MNSSKRNSFILKRQIREINCLTDDEIIERIISGEVIYYFLRNPSKKVKEFYTNFTAHKSL